MSTLYVSGSWQETRMRVIDHLVARSVATAELSVILSQAAVTASFIVGGEIFDCRPESSNDRMWSFQAIQYLRPPETPLMDLIAEARVLARFIETGEIDVTSLGVSSSAQPQSPSGLPPVAPQYPSALLESGSQLDRSLQVSIGGVATPMVAYRNDPDNGIVSTPIPDGGA